MPCHTLLFRQFTQAAEAVSKVFPRFYLSLSRYWFLFKKMCTIVIKIQMDCSSISTVMRENFPSKFVHPSCLTLFLTTSSGTQNEETSPCPYRAALPTPAKGEQRTRVAKKVARSVAQKRT